jgi:hypothetical protein
VFREVGETETTQENIEYWLERNEGNSGFQLLTEEEIAAVIFLLFIFFSTISVIKFSIYLFSKFLTLKTLIYEGTNGMKLLVTKFVT